MRLLHVPQKSFARHLIGHNLEASRFSFCCIICEGRNDVVLINISDWLYCACKHEYLAQDFFDNEQLFTLRLACTTELVDLLRLARVTLNSDKQERICMKIGNLLQITGNWREVMAYVDKQHREAVQQSKNCQDLPWIF